MRNITSDVTEGEKKFLSPSSAVSSAGWQSILILSALEVVGNKLREIALALYIFQVFIEQRCESSFSL